MSDPKYSLQCVSNVFIKMMEFTEPGQVEELHHHVFDHTQVLASGTVKLTVNGVESLHTGPKLLFIAKNTEHSVEAVTPAVVLCVHALRDGYGVDDIIAPDAIPPGVEGTVIGSDDYTESKILPLIYDNDASKLTESIQTVYVSKYSDGSTAG